MVEEIFINPRTAFSCVQFAEIAPLPSGIMPEERAVIFGMGWERYLGFDKALGDDRPGPRLYYLDGDLEIMSTSKEHERIKEYIGDFMADFFWETQTQNMPRGQATMQMLEEAGAEPDKSWCVGEEGEWPDIVLEIALTSGALSKLEIYRRFHVPEVWFWRRDALEVWNLRADGSGYDGPAPASRVLPALPVALIVRCVPIADWLAARRAFREGLAGHSA